METPKANNYQQNIENIVGVDEVGRGALAGPVVITAIKLTNTCPIAELKDSKLRHLPFGKAYLKPLRELHSIEDLNNFI